MARKFRVNDVVVVIEKARKEVRGVCRRTWVRLGWVGTVRDYDSGWASPYGVQAGKARYWAWFSARELYLVERPKK